MPFAMLVRIIHIYSVHYLISLAFFICISLKLLIISFTGIRCFSLLRFVLANTSGFRSERFTVVCSPLCQNLKLVVVLQRTTLYTECVLHSARARQQHVEHDYFLSSLLSQKRISLFSIVVTIICPRGFNFPCSCSQFKNYSKNKKYIYI